MRVSWGCRGDSTDEMEAVSSESGDSWRPAAAKKKRGTAPVTSPGGSVHVNPAGKGKGKKLQGGNSLKMPPAEWQLEDESDQQSESSLKKKARLGNNKVKRKRSKQQGAQRREDMPAETPQPAPAQNDAAAQQPRRTSKFFEPGAKSEANHHLKSFRKTKLFDASRPAREPTDSASAELATADLGIADGRSQEQSKHATPMVSPRSRTTTASSPGDFYVSKQPHVPPAAARAGSPASASVQYVASMPSPKHAKHGHTPAQKQGKTSQKQPSSPPSKMLATSPKADAAAQGDSEPSDKVGDWNPEGEPRTVSSEAEAGPSPEPSSIVVEANDSPASSHPAEQPAILPQDPNNDPAAVIPDTQQQSSADEKGSVSVVDDTPEKTSWATGEDSQGNQPSGSLGRGQEGNSAGKHGLSQIAAKQSETSQDCAMH